MTVLASWRRLSTPRLRVMMVCCVIWATLLYALLSVTGTLSPRHALITHQGESRRWECIKRDCVEEAHGYGTPDVGPPGEGGTAQDDRACGVGTARRFTSIAECRHVCSEFSTIWPRPTGIFNISREAVEISVEGLNLDTEGVKGGDIARDFVREAGLETVSRVARSTCSQHSLPPSVWSSDLRGDVPPSQLRLLSVSVFTTSLDGLRLDWTTDESYSLSINSSDSGVWASIRSVSVLGARHGLQTLSQLLACRVLGEERRLLVMSHAHITDSPAYSHRGILLDTSRHFLPVSSILRTLDGMAASKLNVLHWHATDSHSFPLQSRSVPNLTRYGAYSEKEVYSYQDVKTIRNYAYSRGVRIILEIDAPSHAGYGWEWGEEAGLGKLAVCVGAEPWQHHCVQPPCGQLNPTNRNVYDILLSLYKDIRAAFPHDMFHMGADEVLFKCWEQEESITRWMSDHGFNISSEGMLRLWSLFQAESLRAWDLASSLLSLNTTPVIVWSSHLTEPRHIERYLDPSRYVVETWTDESDDTPLELLAKGYKVIVATKSAWYLDHGFWGSTLYSKWDNVYDNRIPHSSLGVYGGEACLWGEFVDKDNLDSRLWPRGAALAERLWSDPDSFSKSALPRLLEHSSRLATLGIHPDTVTPQWCANNDGRC